MTISFTNTLRNILCFPFISCGGRKKVAWVCQWIPQSSSGRKSPRLFVGGLYLYPCTSLACACERRDTEKFRKLSTSNTFPLDTCTCYYDTKVVSLSCDLCHDHRKMSKWGAFLLSYCWCNRFSYCWCNRFSQMWWLKRIQMHSLTVVASLKSRFCQGCIAFEGFRGESIPCLFWLIKAVLIPWLVAPHRLPSPPFYFHITFSAFWPSASIL